jgi:hypothetical protein
MSAPVAHAEPDSAASRVTTALRRGLAELRFPLGVFAVVAIALYAVAQGAFAILPKPFIPDHGFPDYAGFNAWPRWDSDWYLHIAREGYYYAGPGKQSAVAFFPGYPAVVRAAMIVFRDDIVSGVIVTYLAGAATVALFYRWCLGAFGRQAARTSVLVLVLYPFAYYLFGAVYSDALFLAATLGAFLLLESRHPWLAGVTGALAVASRPVGMAVVVGLAIRALELRGVFEGGPDRFGSGEEPAAAGHRTPVLPRRIRLSRLAWHDVGVLLSISGLVAFCALMWRNFGDPFVFNKVYSAEGWSRTWDARTLLKVQFYEILRDNDFGFVHFYLTAAAVFTLTAIALVPLVFRRLGWGYGAYSAIVLVLPAATSANFLGMGRYVLAAFPCFAVVGAALAGRLRSALSTAWLALSTVGLGFMMTLYARWFLIS